MKIQHKQKDGIEFFELEGDLDFHTSPEFREELQELIAKEVKKIIVNLKKVQYIDSSGLATFVEALQKMKRYQGKLVLTELAASVRSVFEIAKLDKVFALANSEGEALSLVAKT